jgi:hypothetical protein
MFATVVYRFFPNAVWKYPPPRQQHDYFNEDIALAITASTRKRIKCKILKEGSLINTVRQTR